MKDVKKFTDSSFGRNEEFRALEWSAHSPHCRADLTGQVMDELDEYFSTRAITYISGQRELLRYTVRLMLGEAEKPVTTIPLLPGMGKSTLVRALVKVLTREFVRMSDYAKSLGGVILVVEKTAEAYELRDLIQENAPNRDLVRVLEGPNDFNIAHGGCQRSDVQTYAECPGKDCPQAAECRLLHAADKANQTPFLVFMHARYDQYYIENLSALREWSSGEETIYTRKLLIVDEAPNLMKVSKLSTSVIAACEGMISTYKPSYELSWDKPKQTLLSTLNYSLRIPFQKLLRQYKANGSRIAMATSDDFNAAAFDWSKLDPFCDQLERYAGPRSDEIIETVSVLSKQPAAYQIGQEHELTVPHCRLFDIRDDLHTFILSGSAFLSPELYENPEVDIHSAVVQESYQRLTIHVQRSDTRFSVSKTAMANKTTRNVLTVWLKNKLSGMAGHQVLVVTYKGYAKELWDALSEFHDRLIPLQADDNSGPKESLPYFGGMNGSNRYNEADCVICAGLGRFDSEEYFNRALAFDFDGSAWGEFEQACLDSSFRNTDDLACVQKMRNLTMARDLVQLVFRSTLRNHGGKEPVSLWLIQPHEEVVMHVRESFRDCQHDEISELPFECLSELSAGRTFQGKPTHASKLLKWLEDWDGSPILIAEVRGQLGMKPGQWKEARKNAAVKEAFKNIETDGSGKNCKIKRSENVE